MFPPAETLLRKYNQVNFYLYSPISQITNVPQGASQHTTPHVLNVYMYSTLYSIIYNIYVYRQSKVYEGLYI